MNFITIKTLFRLGFVTLFGFSFMLLTVPFIVPLLLISWFVSHFAFLCIKFKFGNSVDKPSGMDIVNGKENDISKPYIYIVCRFTGGNPDIESFRKRFQTLVLDQKDENGKRVFGKFTKIFERVWGYYVWRDCENFNLKNHIRMIESKEFLASYEKKKRQDKREKETLDVESKSDLSDFQWETILNFLITEMIASKSIPSGMPKWEYLFIPESENRYTTVFRLHHSISDGIYLIRLIADCLADAPFEVKLPYKIQKVNFIQRVIQNAMAFSLLPYGLYRALTCNDRNPLHGPKLKGKKKFLLGDTFELSLLKDIKRVAKVTVNDIIFSCVSYAASKHFEKRKSPVEKMTVLLAVNLQKENKPLQLKNNFAVTGLQVPTSSSGFVKNFSQNKQCTILIDKSKSTSRDLTKLPALSRLQIVKYSLDEAKNDPTLMSLCWLLQTLSFLLPASVAEFLLSTKGITMDVSNIQGPQSNDFIMNSALAEDVTFWLPDRDPLGIGVSIISYNGVMRAGIIVDEALMAEDEEGYFFLSNFRQEVLNLHKETMMMKTIREKSENEFSSFLPTDIP